MPATNKVNLIGRLGADLTLRTYGADGVVGNVNLAVNERTRTKTGESRELTSWFKLVFWGESAKNTAKWCGKGSLVAIEGVLRNNNWVDKEGRTRYEVEIHVEDVEFLSTKRPGGSGDADLIVEVGE